jgi:HemY protein
MRGLIWVVGVFAAAVALSLALEGDGYVLIMQPPWRIEVSLVFAIIALLGLFILGYFFVRVAAHTLGLPAHVRAFREERARMRARRALAESAQALVEGRHARADKLADESWHGGEVPALAAVIGARSAQRRRDYARRDEWLERVKSVDPAWRHAHLALRAELLAEERRFEEAREVIKELHAGGLRHLSTQQLLLRCEQGLGNWEEVIRLAQLLAKRGALAKEAAEGIVSGACVAHIERLARDPSRLTAYWKSLDAEERVKPRIAAAAARAFMQLGDCSGGHRAIEAALQSQWDEELVLLYAECHGPGDNTRMEHAERWLNAHPRDWALLLVLGRLCAERELWGKAQSYFEASLSMRPTRAAHLALARLFDAIGRVEEANRHYRASADAGLTS